ncbi:MAG TPA: hypothetical protein VGD65_03910 [Chryseosolibacter sp.]
MQHLNVSLPEKSDFQAWLQDLKQEIISEIKNEVLAKQKPNVVYKTRSEIAKEFRISLVTLHERTKEGCPSIKIGKRRLYNPVEVEKYFIENGYK